MTTLKYIYMNLSVTLLDFFFFIFILLEKKLEFFKILSKREKKREARFDQDKESLSSASE